MVHTWSAPRRNVLQQVSRSIQATLRTNHVHVPLVLMRPAPFLLHAVALDNLRADAAAAKEGHQVI